MGVTAGGVDQHCSTAHSVMEYTHHLVSERSEKKTDGMQTIIFYNSRRTQNKSTVQHSVAGYRYNEIHDLQVAISF